MGQIVWISGATIAIGLLIGASLAGDGSSIAEPVAFEDAAPQATPHATRELELGDAGSALATAAFGLSALQPETYNSQIVHDIIEASPLGYGEKDRLTAKLAAAEAGQAELPSVLADIRVSLAVE